jgi:putative peptidoglycan lipid II flippase
MDENSNQNKNKKKSLVTSGIVLSLMTFASRIMGLIREMTKAKFLGTGLYADAFTTSFMIPNLLRRLFAENSISVAFIPTFKGYLADGDSPENKKSTQDFINSTFTLVTFLTSCVVVIGFFVTPLLAMIFCKKPMDVSAADYTAELNYWLLKKTEITYLTRVMFPYLLLISIAAFFQGILNGCKIFAPSGFTPVLFNATVVLATYLLTPLLTSKIGDTEQASKVAARAMAIGVTTGGCIQAVFQLPFVLKTGWKVGFTSIKKCFTNPGTRKVLALIGPTIIGMAAYQVNDLVSTALANRAGTGIASSLQYSLRLQELILGIFAVSIGTVILPDLSGLAHEKKWDEYNELLVQAIKIITVITIPVTFYSLVCGEDLISLLYKKGGFDELSVKLTTGEFRWHIAGLFFIAMNRIITPAFYAQGNTKLPTMAGIISMAANVVLALVLILPMKGNGIALALSLASAVNTVFLFIFMKKMNSIKIGKVASATLLYVIKILIFSVIAAIPVYFLRKFGFSVWFAGHNRIVSYGIPALILAVVYFIIGVLELIISKDSIVMVIIRKIRKRK